MSRTIVAFVGVAGVAERGKLDVEKEFVEVHDAVRRGHGDFDVVWITMPTVKRLLEYFIEHKPNVLHYAGHGVTGQSAVDHAMVGYRHADLRDAAAASETGAIHLLGDAGEPRLVSARELAAIARAGKLQLACINACHSEELVAPLRGAADAIITIDGEIGDAAARLFSTALYRSLADHRSVAEAFRNAVDALIAEGLDDERLPRLHTDADANEIFLTRAEDERPGALPTPVFDTGAHGKLAQLRTRSGCAACVMALTLIAAAATTLLVLEAHDRALERQQRVEPAPPPARFDPRPPKLPTMQAPPSPPSPSPPPVRRADEVQPVRHDRDAQPDAPPQKPHRVAPPAPPRAPAVAAAPDSAAASAPSGEIDRSIIARYIRERENKFRYCYEKQRLSDPTLHGTVTTKVHITPTGDVAWATADGPDPALNHCVAEVMKSIQFPRSDSAIEIRYPFHFVPRS